MSRYEEIESFVKVVNAGSITNAADQMAIAKSAVSRRLKNLETRLNAQLLQRSTRQLILTDTGRALYERSVNLLADWAETESIASASSVEVAGKLRISIPQTFGLLHLTDVLLEFMKRHPDVELDVDFSDRSVDLFREGYDAAIRIGKLTDSSLIARRLSTIENVVTASPAYLDKHGMPSHPDDLATHKECAYRNRTNRIWRYSLADGSMGKVVMESEPRLYATSGEFLRASVVAGEGITKLPRFFIHKELRAGRLITLLPELTWEEYPLSVLYLPTRHLSSRVRALVDYLSEEFSGTPSWDQSIPED